MALCELKLKLPHGGVGRLINSFIFPSHPDTLNEIRMFYETLKTEESHTNSYLAIKEITMAIQSFESSNEGYDIWDFLIDNIELFVT